MAALHSLVYNLALGLATLALFNVLSRWPLFRAIRTPWTGGVVAGALAVACMLEPWENWPGVLIDGRVVFLGLAGLFGGGRAALGAILVAAAGRLALGGAGVPAGLALIVLPAALGAWLHRRWRPDGSLRDLPRLLAFGLALAALFLACLLLVPSQILRPLLADVLLPILVVVPVYTVLLGSVFAVEGALLARQAQLRESELQFRTFFETNLDAILQVERPGGRALSLNPAARRLLGLGADEAPTGTLWERLDLDPAQIADAEEILDSQGQFVERCHVRKPDGGEIPVELYLVVWADADGRSRAWVSLRDLSQQQAQERRTRMLATLVEQSADSILVTDPQGRIVYVNRAFETSNGWLAAEVEGQTPASLLGDQLDPAIREQIWQSLSNKQVWQGKLDSVSRTGRPLRENVTIFPVLDPGNGEIQHLAAVKRDLGREEQLEHELRQSQKMEAIGRLAGGVAHDFNNILAIILGTADLIRQGFAASPSPAEDAEEIVRAAERGASLTRQLLAFSRMQPLNPVRLDTRHALGAILKLVQRIVGRDVVLETRLDPALSAVVADPGQFDQVLLNLAVNARDAMPDGGRLSVTADNQTLSDNRPLPAGATGPGEYVRIRVADTGCGIPADALPRIFEPFFTTKGPGQGTGLGLSTVFGIVKQSGGWLEVESTPGSGTCFSIWWPRDARQPATAAAPAPPPVRDATARQLRILLVDDEESVRRTAGRMLESAGHQVRLAAGGAEALLAVEREAPFDLLICDVMMPLLNGFELVQRLRRLHPDLPVLHITGILDVEGTPGHPDRLAPDALLMKPFTTQELLRRVAALAG